MTLTRTKTKSKIEVIDLENMEFVDAGKEEPKPKRARKTRVATSKVKKKLPNTTSKQKKVVKREPVTRKSAPKERKPKVKSETASKPTANKKTVKRNSGIVIPEGLDIPNDMKGRIIRASREKLYIISRERVGFHQEEYQVSGSTGNLYTVVIGTRLSCTCQDYRYRRVHCKHLLSVLLKAFRLPITSAMFFNLTPSIPVLQEVFEKCIPDPSYFVPQELQPLISKRINGEPEADTSAQVQRRPLDTSDCPVCCEEFETDKINEVIYCRTCGNNIHQACFNMWKASRGNNVTCVFCRSPWEVKKKDKAKKKVNVEGFVNIGQELGLPEKRDCSGYSRVYGDLNEELSKGLDEEVGIPKRYI